MRQYQHGDVLLEEVDPGSVTLTTLMSKEGIVLAEGEVTGHMHRVKERAELLQAPDGSWYLLTRREETTITHEEHKALTLPAGLYKVGIVREFDYIEQSARRVVD